MRLPVVGTRSLFVVLSLYVFIISGNNKYSDFRFYSNAFYCFLSNRLLYGRIQCTLDTWPAYRSLFPIRLSVVNGFSGSVVVVVVVIVVLTCDTKRCRGINFD